MYTQCKLTFTYKEALLTLRNCECSKHSLLLLCSVCVYKWPRFTMFLTPGVIVNVVGFFHLAASDKLGLETAYKSPFCPFSWAYLSGSLLWFLTLHCAVSEKSPWRLCTGISSVASKMKYSPAGHGSGFSCGSKQSPLGVRSTWCWKLSPPPLTIPCKAVALSSGLSVSTPLHNIMLSIAQCLCVRARSEMVKNTYLRNNF